MRTGHRFALIASALLLIGSSVNSVGVSGAANASTYGALGRGAPTRSGSSRLAVDGIVYFTALDGTHGRELWRSDGTDAGTTMVKDVRPGRKGSNPGRLTELDGTLFFDAVDGAHGRELWKSDGTDEGTVMVRDIRPGARGSATHAFYPLEKLGIEAGMLYFAANDGIHGSELWRSDGTAAGTVMVKDIHPGHRYSVPRYFTDVGGQLFFVADGSQIWKSDGTGTGTVLVERIQDSGLGSLTNVAGTLYFVTDYHLWRSDGTSAGTVPVKDVIALQWLTVVDRTMYFAAAEYFADTGSAGDYELWRSDGTTAGTVVVKKINPTRSTSPSWLTDVRGTLYFNASDGSHGWELWRSDGTDAGTVLVKDVQPGSAYPTWLTDVRGTLYFIGKGGTDRSALWKSDGTDAGTVLVKDIRVGWRRYLPWLTVANGTLYFTARDGTHGFELWRSDGSPTGTLPLKDIKAGSASSGPSHFVYVPG